MDFSFLIKPELFILIPVLYMLGRLFKQSPKIADWLIPLLLIITSIVLTPIYLIAISSFDWQNILIGIIQGVFIALTTVGSNELVKQSFIKSNSITAENTKNSSENKNIIQK